MTFSRPPHTPARRALYRAPIWLYRLGLGGLLGRRFVLLTHIGRVTGRPRHVVLEVVGRDEESGGFLIASGYGARAQWFRNIRAEPRVRFQIGRRRYAGTARPLPAAESGRRLAEYAARHPWIAAELLTAIGRYVDGTAVNYRRVGADTERGVPVILLRPDPS